MLDESCKKCQSIINSVKNNKPFEECFTWLGIVSYDIDKAKKIISDERPVFQLSTNDLQGFQSYTGVPGRFNAMSTDVDENHIDHVSDSIDDPIILAYSLKPFPTRKNKSKRFRMPVDGHHRIAKAVKYNQPFVYGFLLSEEESDSIITDHRLSRR